MNNCTLRIRASVSKLLAVKLVKLKKYGSIRRSLLGTRYLFIPINKGGLATEELSGSELGTQLIIEVGSNEGIDTQNMLDAYPRAQLLCFEPDHRAAQIWREKIRSTRATLYEYAIGNEDGKTVFYGSMGDKPESLTDRKFSDWNQSGSIRKPKLHLQRFPWVSFRAPSAVEIRRLDTIVGEVGLLEDRADFFLIWADVQGAEEDLIRGAERTLRRTRYFYTEYSNEELYEGQSNLRRLCRLLPNFRIRKLFTNDVLFENIYLR